MNPSDTENNAVPAPPRPRAPIYYKPHVLKIIRALEQSEPVLPTPVTNGETARLTSREDTPVKQGSQA
ncbi:MAG TPA: hypothetical protein VI547_03395 [Anaerolineales bacterium]|nr:hypothetical protein [Anaerolineales bacterium]